MFTNVDKIIKGFRKTVAQLEKYAADQAEHIEQLNSQLSKAEYELARADRIAEKLSTLLD